MEQFGEFIDGKNYVITEFHPWLTIEFLESRMERILSETGIYDPAEIILHADLGRIPGTASFGVIRTRRGRIFELHVLDHPGAIDQALLNANGKKFDFLPHRQKTLQ